MKGQHILAVALLLSLLAAFACKPSAVQTAAPPAAKNPSTGASDVATSNSASQEFELGKKYLNGIGVPQDYGAAVKWNREAGGQGNAVAQHELGLCYYTGQGAPQNYAEAVKWFRKAAEQGKALAQHDLGLCYCTGQGVPQDYAEAVKWFRKAAEQGEARAQYFLGAGYADGQGVPKNDVEAYKWFNIAAAQGIKVAAEARQRIAARMTPDQIAEAQRLSSAFVPRKESAPQPAPRPVR